MEESVALPLPDQNPNPKLPAGQDVHSDKNVACVLRPPVLKHRPTLFTASLILALVGLLLISISFYAEHRMVKNLPGQHVDPCHDFYKYTCQGVHKPQKRQTTAVTMKGEMTWKNVELVKQLIQNLPASSNGSREVARNFFFSCKTTNWTLEPYFNKTEFVAMVKNESTSNSLNTPDLDIDPTQWEWELENMIVLLNDSQRQRDLYDEALSNFCSSCTILMLPEVAAELFIENDYKLFENKYKSVQTLIENLLDTYTSTAKNFSWMDLQSQMNFIESMKEILVLNPFENSETDDTTEIDNFYGNVTINPSDDFVENLMKLSRARDTTVKGQFLALLSKAALNANAFHFNSPRRGSLIFISPGIAQLPSFHVDFPEVLKFAKLGFTIGHEYAHSFRYIVRLGTSSDNRTEEARQKIENCLVEQYNGFQVSLPPKFNAIKLFVNGSLTLYENLADILGLQMAFESFIQNNNNVSLVIPGFEGLTKEQVFFIAHAQERCETFKDDKSEVSRLMAQVRMDPHSPNSIRVLGTFSNFKEFAKAFGCPVGSPYNPVKKCDIFAP